MRRSAGDPRGVFFELNNDDVDVLSRDETANATFIVAEALPHIFTVIGSLSSSLNDYLFKPSLK